MNASYVKKLTSLKLKRVACIFIALLLSFTAIFAVADAIQKPALNASAAGVVTTETVASEDAAEVSKGDIVDFTLIARFNANSDDKSGIVTFTDPLPKNMELVTGTQTVKGQTVNCTPCLSSNSFATWVYSGADSGYGDLEAGDFTYDSQTRTLKCYIKDMVGTGDDVNLAEASIKIYARVTDDASTLEPSVNLLYYTNYVAVKYAKATAISNKVRFYSGYSEAEKYIIHYAWAGVTGDGEENEPPAGVSLPEDVTYQKSEDNPPTAVAISPAMEHNGYSFEGWTISQESAIDGVSLTEEGLVWPSSVEGTEITLVGKWTKIDKTFELENTWIGWDSKSNSKSDDDRPNLEERTGDKGSRIDFGESVSIPKYPETTKTSSDEADENDPYASLYDSYNFLGFDYIATYSKDGVETNNNLRLTDEEKIQGQITPKGGTDDGVLTKLEIQGKWERKTFNFTFAKGVNWPDSVALDTFPGVEGGELKDEGAKYVVSSKWGKKIGAPTTYEIKGARFVRWNFDPELIKDAETSSTVLATYVMPKKDVNVTGDFEKTYTLTTKNATFEVAGYDAGQTSQQVVAGSYVSVTPTEIGDIKFSSFTYNDGKDPAGEQSILDQWTQGDDSVATFTMPESDVTITANMALELKFNIKNGKWADGLADSKVYKLPMTKNANESWSGTLTQENVDSTVGDVASATADKTFNQDSGHWESEAAGNLTFSSSFLASNYFTCGVDGMFDTTKKKEFIFSFDLRDEISVTYKVSPYSSGLGKVALMRSDGLDLVYDGEVSTAKFSPLSIAENAAGTAIAKAEENSYFVRWADENSLDPNESLSETEEFTPEKEVIDGQEMYAEKTYVAYFKKKTFTVGFDPNGGVGTMENQSFVYDEPKNLSANRFTRDGFEFAGWNTVADGSGTAFADCQKVQKLSNENEGVVKLYAQWRHKAGDLVSETRVFGNDIWMTVVDAKNLLAKSQSEQLVQVVKSAKAFAIKRDDVAMQTKSVDITKADLSDVRAQCGDYNATLSTEDGANVTIVIHVTYGEDDTIKIGAHTFRISIDEAKAILEGKTLSELNGVNLAEDDGLNDGQNEVIRLASATATRSLSGDVAKIKEVQTTIETVKGGGFTATFKVNDGVTDTVGEIVVADNSSEDAEIKTRMTSNNIELTFEEAGSLLSKSKSEITDELIKKCDAYAYLTDSADKVSVEGAKWDIEQKEGTYSATFSTKEGADVTSTVKVGPQTGTADNTASTDEDATTTTAGLSQTGDKLLMAIGILLLIMLISLITTRLSRFNQRPASDKAVSSNADSLRSSAPSKRKLSIFVAGGLTLTFIAGFMCLNSTSVTALGNQLTFDDVSFQQGATITLNGTHTVTAVSDSELIADETNGEQVESSEANRVLASFKSQKYESDSLATKMSNDQLPSIYLFNKSKPYLGPVDYSYWLNDTMISPLNTGIQAYRTEINEVEPSWRTVRGKDPKGILDYTPGPSWAGQQILTYVASGSPRTGFDMSGWDFQEEYTLDDTSWPDTTWVWTGDAKEKLIVPSEWTTSLSTTIYPGKEVYNNPYCIEDPSRGFYKTTTTSYYDYEKESIIHGRVEVDEATESSPKAAFISYMWDGSGMEPNIKEGDILFLSGIESFQLSDTTGFLGEDESRPSSGTRYNIYFKAEEDARITGKAIDYLQGRIIGFHDGSDMDGVIKGSTLNAGLHAVRPLYNVNKKDIAFFRDCESNQVLTVSSTVGKTPTSIAKNSKTQKCVVRTSDVSISFDVSTENCSTDRDEGRDKRTVVEGTTIKVPRKSKVLTLKNVSTTNATYVSALVQNGMKRYGVLAYADGSDIKLDLSNILSTSEVGDKMTVSLFAEKPSEAGYSDSISETPVTFDVVVSGHAPQKIVYDANGGTGKLPDVTYGNAGDVVEIGSGAGLVSEKGNPFSYWELSYTLFGDTKTTTVKYRSGDHIVMPDALGDPDCGIITAKAMYVGGMTAYKNTETSGEYSRIIWDSNSGSSFDARLNNLSGDKTKTVVKPYTGQDLTISESDVPVAVNITDNSNYYMVGWSTNKNAHAGDDDVFTANELKGKTLIGRKTTYYAVWTRFDNSSYYWLGTANADKTYYNEACFYYNDPNYVSGTQIEADMRILRNKSNSKYEETKAKWENYYNEDIRLYTTYSGGSTAPLWNTGAADVATLYVPQNALFEFRIIEVSGSDGHDGDGSVVTFMATHLTPDAYSMTSTTVTNIGGWGSSSLRTIMNSGAIFKKFNTNFTNKIKSVKKSYNAGGDGNSVDRAASTCYDKFWVPSVTELFARKEGYSRKYWPNGEGQIYEWCKKINAVTSTLVGSNSSYILKTRCGQNGRYGSGSWFTRTPHVQNNTQWASISSSEGTTVPSSFSTHIYGVCIAFCF